MASSCENSDLSEKNADRNFKENERSEKPETKTENENNMIYRQEKLVKLSHYFLYYHEYFENFFEEIGWNQAIEQKQFEILFESLKEKLSEKINCIVRWEDNKEKSWKNGNFKKVCECKLKCKQLKIFTNFERDIADSFSRSFDAIFMNQKKNGREEEDFEQSVKDISEMCKLLTRAFEAFEKYLNIGFNMGTNNLRNKFIRDVSNNLNNAKIMMKSGKICEFFLARNFDVKDIVQELNSVLSEYGVDPIILECDKS